jgi:D-alanyl-D-alanine carboxypeptidase (penicillin-binding protein 5/6)
VLSVLGLAVIATTLLRFSAIHSSDNKNPSVLGAHTEQFDIQDLPVLSLPPNRVQKNNPNIQAKSAYLLDVESSYPLFAKNENEQVPIASTTKLMTAVIARKTYQLTDIATTSERAASINGSKILLRVGEKMDVKSLLTGLLIQSGNDAAMALAEHMGLEAFVAAMNDEAAFLGMTGTVFKDPAGLDDQGHSTARDLAILAAYVIRDDVIQSIVQTTQTTVTSSDGSRIHAIESSNRLIKSDHPLYVPEATGLKTGFTPDAGHCLVASATKNGRAIVSVILHTNNASNEASAQESRKLLNWGFATYSWDIK